MPRRTTRKLEVYTISARTNNGPVDYADLFETTSKARRQDRYDEIGTRLIAVPVLSVAGGKAFLVTYEGEKGLQPLIFDAARARERIQRLLAGEVVATKTHVLIGLGTRVAIIEYNHRGAKADDIARVLESIARRIPEYQSILIDFAPVVDEEFLEALEHFTRIRVADLRLTRPNIDWTDNYDHLSAVARESRGRSIAVTVWAGRGESLDPKRGIIRIIRDGIQGAIEAVKGVRILGTREGETEETSISTGRYVEHQKVDVVLTRDGHVNTNDIKRKMMQFLRARQARRGPDAEGD